MPTTSTSSTRNSQHVTDKFNTIWSGSTGHHRFTYTELVSYLTEMTTANPKRHLIRLTIHVDGYNEQSYARAERWNGERWHHLWEIPGPLLKTKQPLGINDEWTPEDHVFDDRRSLLWFVWNIL